MNEKRCIGIIMDGNRRWARAAGKPLFLGHRQGYLKLKEFLGWAKDAGANTVIAYALSTENWKRAPDEINYLMKLFRFVLSHEIVELKKSGVSLRFIGDISRFPEDIRAGMAVAEEKTEKCGEFTLAVATSYGGRAEIVNAAKRIVGENMSAEKISEETFSDYLWTRGLPDPNMIIRTGGETRLSNFLPWQSTYSELFFTKTLWPNFSQEEFKKILLEFSRRKMNFGK